MSAIPAVPGLAAAPQAIIPAVPVSVIAAAVSPSVSVRLFLVTAATLHEILARSLTGPPRSPPTTHRVSTSATDTVG